MTERHWVQTRMKCTPAHYVGELMKVIERDINKFNSLPRTIEHKHFFMVEHEPDGNHTIHRARRIEYSANKHEMVRKSQDDHDFVKISHTETALIAIRKDVWCCEVRLDWNEEDLTCDLILDGQARDLAHISQRILGDFLFEDLGP